MPPALSITRLLRRLVAQDCIQGTSRIRTDTPKLIKTLSATPTLPAQSHEGLSGDPQDPQASLQANRASFFFRLVGLIFLYIMLRLHTLEDVLRCPILCSLSIAREYGASARCMVIREAFRKGPSTNSPSGFYPGIQLALLHVILPPNFGAFPSVFLFHSIKQENRSALATMELPTNHGDSCLEPNERHSTIDADHEFRNESWRRSISSTSRRKLR